MKYTYALIASLAALFVGGLGFFARNHFLDPNVRQGYESAAYLPDIAGKPENERNTEELRAILAAFQEAKSFRSSIVVRQNGSATEGEIAVMKPNRFHGKMNVDGQAVEVIGVEDVLYIKSPEGVWVPIRSDAMTEQLNETFSYALGATETDTGSLLDGVTVTKKVDPALACDRYDTAVSDSDGVEMRFTICAKDGYPAHIEAERDGMTITADYSDYNELFVIERPTIPRVFWPGVNT